MLNNLDTSKRNNIIIAVNSTIIYIFTFLITYIIYQLITATVASEYRVDTVFYLDNLKFLTPDNNFEIWTRDSAITVFGAAPIISLVLAFISIMMYRRFSEDNSIIKLFFLWGALHFINRVLGSFIIGTIFFLYGSNLIADWMYLGTEMKIVITAIALIVQIIIGAYTVIPILTSANTSSMVKGENRRSFIFNQIYIPWLIGSVCLFLFFLPKLPIMENLINVTMLIMLVPLYFRYRSPMLPGAEEEHEEVVYKFSWRFVIFLIIFVIFLKIVFIEGIPFGGKAGTDMDYIWVFILIIAIISGLIYQFIKSSNDRKREIRKIMGNDERTY